MWDRVRLCVGKAWVQARSGAELASGAAPLGSTGTQAGCIRCWVVQEARQQLL